MGQSPGAQSADPGETESGVALASLPSSSLFGSSVSIIQGQTFSGSEISRPAFATLPRNSAYLQGFGKCSK